MSGAAGGPHNPGEGDMRDVTKLFLAGIILFVGGIGLMLGVNIYIGIPITMCGAFLIGVTGTALDE